MCAAFHTESRAKYRYTGKKLSSAYNMSGISDCHHREMEIQKGRVCCAGQSVLFAVPGICIAAFGNIKDRKALSFLPAVTSP